MVYLDYITCLRYTILVRNPRFVSADLFLRYSSMLLGHYVANQPTKQQLENYTPHSSRNTPFSHAYIYKHEHSQSYMHLWMQSYQPFYLHKTTHTHTHTHTHTYIHTHTHTQTDRQTDRQRDIHTYIHTYRHTYTYSPHGFTFKWQGLFFKLRGPLCICPFAYRTLWAVLLFTHHALPTYLQPSSSDHPFCLLPLILMSVITSLPFATSPLLCGLH